MVTTFNRADFLGRTLSSLVRQTLAPEDFEILVIDNNSTDGTPDLVGRLARLNPSVRYVLEERQGVSLARNRGLAEAYAPIVAFIDDDAVADEEWLATAIRCFEDVAPKPQIVGGPILPFYWGRRPEWAWDSYMMSTWGDAARLLEPGECFYGSNFFLRPEALPEAASFDPDLGVRGSTLFLGEDDRYFASLWQVMGGEARFMFCPGAKVFHSVPESRATVGYALRRSFVEGQTLAAWHESEPTMSRVAYVRLMAHRLRLEPARLAREGRNAPSVSYWAAHDLSRAAKLLGRLLWTVGVRPALRRM